MNEIKWIKGLKSDSLPDASTLDVSRSVLRDIRTMTALQRVQLESHDSFLVTRIWAFIAGAGALASVAIGFFAFDVWQSAFGASAELFTLWDVVMR